MPAEKQTKEGIGRTDRLAQESPLAQRLGQGHSPADVTPSLQAEIAAYTQLFLRHDTS